MVQKGTKNVSNYEEGDKNEKILHIDSYDLCRNVIFV